MSEAPHLPVAADWFSLTWVTARTAVMTEPHMDDLLRAGIWYLRGRDRDLLVDTGNGAGELRPYLARLARSGRPRDIVCVCTHAHIDHIGGFHEFERRLLHPAEQELAASVRNGAPLAPAVWSPEILAQLAESGFVPPPVLVDAIPYPGFDPYTFKPGRAAPTRLVRGGDEIDLGDRRFTVVGASGCTTKCRLTLERRLASMKSRLVSVAPRPVTRCTSSQKPATWLATASTPPA